MKLNMTKRILMFFHWLFSLLICAALALSLIVPELFSGLCAKLEGRLGPLGVRILGFALLAVYVVLAVLQLCLILNRKKRADRGFIEVTSSDSGKVRIAVSAVEQMVRQSVRSIDGINEMKISIDSVDDAIVIGVDATILSGSHVPSITSNMQRSIRQFVEMNCGVPVRSISVSINAVSAQPESGRKGFLGRAKLQGKTASAKDAGGLAQPQVGGFASASDADAPVVEASAADVGVEFKSAAPDNLVFESRDGTGADTRTESPAYDFDKPYESEFMKDFAAMKAREAEGESQAPKQD